MWASSCSQKRASTTVPVASSTAISSVSGGTWSPKRVMTAVHLDQHTLPGHPLAADTVLGRAPSPGTAQSGADQDAPQGGPADVDAVPLSQQLAQMSVVGPSVSGPNALPRPPRPPVLCWAACGTGDREPGRLRPDPGSRRDASGVSGADTHQCCRLIQRHVFSQQAVQDLKPGLFFGSQSHILHGEM